MDSLSQAGVKILVLHDFDKSGLRICHWLSHDSPRYKYKVPPDVIDIGLRLPDVKRLKLENEEVRYHQKKHPGLVLCDCEDVTKAFDFVVPGDGIEPSRPVTDPGF